MRNKASGFYSSSLEMLLDTMCNVLGGIIFIALMVALLARDTLPTSAALEQGRAAQLSNDLSSVLASNIVIETAIQSTLRRLQDPQHEPRTNFVRLPDLSKTTKQPWTVIVRYGSVFPLDVFSAAGGDSVARNLRAVQHERSSNFVEPIPGRGLEPEAAVAQMVQAFKARSQTNFYFAFWVYQDSFDAFAQARATADRLGFQYGWNPLLENQRLQLGRAGERALPQN